MNAAEIYRARRDGWVARRDRAAARAVTFSRFRIVTFLAAAALIWWGLASAWPAVTTAGVAGLLGFGGLVVFHARILEEIDRAAAAVALNDIALARLARDWKALPDVPVPPDLDLDAHPYARDLDLYGHASLATWLGRAATPDGARRLSHWLLTPADPTRILDRQAAIEDLSSRRDWRERLGIEGQLARVDGSDLTRFLEWAESRESAVPAIMPAVAWIVPLSTAVLFGIFSTGATEAAVWLLPLVIAVILSFAYAGRIYAVFDRSAVGQRALERYAAMLSLVCRESWTAPALVQIQARMRVGGDAPAIVRHLARLTGFSELRSGAALLHFPIQALTLWDFHILLALERWRARSGRHVRGWLEALGSIDALATLAAVRADQTEWVTPAVDPASDALAATSLGHPLIADDRRVTNDVQVGPRGSILLITGSNMSGKSTLLRAIGLNAVLAQTGSPVCAASFAMPPVDLHTSIRVQDSLELGLSYFMAALARLKQIVDAAERGSLAPGQQLLYLLDEVLQGTNSVERAIAVRAVAHHLLDAGAIGAMTTHDLGLADEPPLSSAARLVHFTEQVHAEGAMTFDYRLRPGLATSTNALRLMQLIGIPAR